MRYYGAGIHHAAGTEPQQRGRRTISATLFVGNLNFRTSEASVYDLLSAAGQIVNIHLPSDRVSGQPRGFAFVEFASREEAVAAVERFNGHELDGRELRINEAEERPRRSGPRPGGARNGPGAGGGGRGDHHGGRRSGKPKGSRRSLRARKRSL